MNQASTPSKTFSASSVLPRLGTYDTWGTGGHVAHPVEVDLALRLLCHGDDVVDFDIRLAIPTYKGHAVRTTDSTLIIVEHPDMVGKLEGALEGRRR